MRTLAPRPDGCLTGAGASRSPIGPRAVWPTSSRPSPDAISYSTAISACAGEGQWKLAVALLDRMEARQLSPHVGTFTAVMQALVAASERVEGFAVLERLHAYPKLVGRSYPTHLVLLKACQAAGETARAHDLQTTMDGLGIAKTLSARVTFSSRPGRRTSAPGLVTRQLGNGPHYGRLAAASDAALDNLYRRVCAETPYRPQLEALPFAFAQRATGAEQLTSLKLHAEKKALAQMLREDDCASELSMRINFSVCADCQAFLTHAAQMLGRRITVLEPSRTHVFEAARGCSCHIIQDHRTAARASGGVVLGGVKRN